MRDFTARCLDRVRTLTQRTFLPPPEEHKTVGVDVERGGERRPAGPVRTAVEQHRPADAASRAWLARLRCDGRERDVALRQLHTLLLRAAHFTVAQRRWAVPQLRGSELDEIAIEAADDAVLAVLRHLDDYRGDSLFTTWAYKFVFLEAAAAVRRRSWKNREVALEGDGPELVVDAGVEEGADAAQLLEALRAALAQALTAHQRLVFVAVCLQGIPIDVLAERLETTRGALYKTVHDARRKLRAELTAAGFAPATFAPEEQRRESLAVVVS